MARGGKDRFGNIGSVICTQSAADTLTFAELQTGISLGQGIGILIDNFEYLVSSSALALMTTAADEITVGWSTSNAFTSIHLNERRILDTYRVQRADFGAAASGGLEHQPWKNAHFPPIIVAAPRLYLFIGSTGLASATTVSSRMYFRYIDLSSQEYLELAETFVLVG